MSQRKVLLLEPNYKNKYPPMGLAKLATYHRCRHDDVRFYKGNLKEFAISLLLEEFMASIDIQNNPCDNVIHLYLTKRGPKLLLEYINTGKNICLETISYFSQTLSECEDISPAELGERLAFLRTRFKQGDFPKFDRVCITTLFTFYWKETIETILFAKKICISEKEIFIGGIAASLVPSYIEQETGISPYVGQLNTPFGYDTDEKGGAIIDELPLDYSILEEIDYRYPTEDAYFGYMTRGCVNKCTFCAVPKLEPNYCNYISIKDKIAKIEECFGAKRHLLLMDNNVFASCSFHKIIDEIKECGFEKGAKYIPPNEYDITYRNLILGFALGTNGEKVFNDRGYIKKIINIYDAISERIINSADKGEFYNLREALGLLFVQTATKDSIITFHHIAKPLYDKHFKKTKRVRYVDFNQGLDSRLASDDKLKKISETAIRPLRIAFDHWKMQKTYEKAIRTAAKYGIRDLSNYLLYNFEERPEDLYYRMKLNVDLCEELGVTIYSFPMKYHPIDDPEYFRNRDFIGPKFWNRKFIRAIQAVLNSTHGKIGKGKSFFQAAFGKNIEEFRKILWMPEAFIIQRYMYDKNMRLEYFGNKPTPYDNVDDFTSNTTDRWWAEFTSLSPSQREIAEEIIKQNIFTDAHIEGCDEQVTSVLKYYQVKRGK